MTSDTAGKSVQNEFATREDYLEWFKSRLKDQDPNKRKTGAGKVGFKDPTGTPALNIKNNNTTLG